MSDKAKAKAAGVMGALLIAIVLAIMLFASISMLRETRQPQPKPDWEQIIKKEQA